MTFPRWRKYVDSDQRPFWKLKVGWFEVHVFDKLQRVEGMFHG